jgi:Domain of unknown function (DUF1844)
MSEKEKPFIVNDRRKFTLEGELREPVEHSEETAKPTPEPPATTPAKEPVAGPRVVEFAPKVSAASEAPEEPQAAASDEPAGEEGEEVLASGPTEEEVAQSQQAYQATVDRLDTVMRATNPGGEHLPPMSFDRVVQSVYMTAMMQLGAGAQPGEQARVDLMGARQSVDMLSILAEKTKGNLSDPESKLLESALFELRMAFLEITQVLARQAAAKQGAPGKPGTGPLGVGPLGNGPKIVS